MAPVKKVLFCCEHYWPSVGGVQEVMRQIAERFVSYGHEVWVATGCHSDRAEVEQINGVHVVSFPISGNKVKGLRGPCSDYRRFIFENNFDVILIKAAQQWTFDALIDYIDDFAGKRFFIPCGFSSLNDIEYASYYRSMKDWLLKFDSLIFYSSKYQDFIFARDLGIENVTVIPNGVDEREFLRPVGGSVGTRLGIPDGNDILLSVGSKIYSKGHWEVYRAFRKANLPRPATLVINGNTPVSGMMAKIKRVASYFKYKIIPLELLALVSNPFCRNKVLVTNLERKDLIELYALATVFVFASHTEYSPLVVFEASASGCFIVASDAGNTSEIIEWLGNGKVVAPEFGSSAKVSPDRLAVEIERALTDRETSVALAQRGRQNVFGLGFTWEQIALRYQEVMIS